ncbi:MAG: alginate export family protein [Planctomycetes bacterium]|nr:alginate export family protein [Planctomycetota bacterium]
MRRTNTHWACLGGALLTFTVSGAFAQDGQAPEAQAELEALRDQVRQLNDRLEAVEGRGQSATPGKGEAGEPDTLNPVDVAPVDSSDVVIRRGTKDEGLGLVIELPDDMKLRFGAQIRWRGEYRGDRYAQPNGNSSTDFVLQRIRMTFDYDVSARLGARVTIQDSRLWGDKLDGFVGARLASDQSELFIREGYGVVREPFDLPLEIRVGRMAVPQLGDQRLISDLDWSNVGRSFDGAMVTLRPKGWWMTAFATNIREGAALPIPGDENDDVWMFGAYVSNRMVENHEFDAFIYWRRVGDNKLGALTTDSKGDRGARKDYTAGMRFKGEAGPLFYNGMFAYQFGQVAGDTISAWATAVQLGAVFKFGEQKLKVSSEAAWASGDPDSSDGRIETFDPLLPFAHFYNGQQDLFAWRNLYSANFKLAFWPVESLSLHSDLHWFWLNRRDDKWYGVGFTRTDTAKAADDSNVGAEVDLYFKWKVFKERLAFWGGYSHFFPGEYIRDTGSKTSDQSWAFLQATLSF